MSFNVIKNLFGSVAPTIGTALGGPVGGMAAQAIAKVLGCDPAPQSIERALGSATPEQMAEIKKAEIQFQTRMKELEVDVFKLETQDIQNARENFKNDWTPRVIAIMCITFFGLFIGVIIMDETPPDDGLVNLVLGYLGGVVTSIISFYFGASHKE